jgi:hypothetical protein
MAAAPRRRWPVVVALLTALGLVSAIGGVFAYVHTDHFQRNAKTIVEYYVESQTEKELTLGAVQVEFWPPAVTFREINLWDAITGADFVKAQTVRASFVLTRRGPRLGELRLESPEVNLHIGADGQIRELLEFQRPTTTPGQPAPTELPWQRLRIEDGTLNITTADAEIKLAHLSVVPTDGPVADLRATLTLHAHALDAHADLNWPGITLGPDRIALPDARLTLDTDAIPEQPARHVLGAAIALSWPFEGDVEGRLTLDVDADAATAAIPKPTTLHGLVNADATLSGTPQSPVIDVAVLGQELGVDLFAKGVRDLPDTIVHHRYQTVSAAARLTRGGLDLQRAQLWWGEGKITAWGTITPDLQVSGLHLLAEHLSLAQVLWQLDAFQTPYVDFLGDVDMTLDGTLNPLHLDGPFEIAMSDFLVTNGPVREPGQPRVLDIPYGEIGGTITIEPKLVTLDCGTVTSPRGRGTAVAKLGLEPGPIDIRFDIPNMDFDDLRPLGDAQLRGKGHVQGHIWGPGETLQLAGRVVGLREFGVNGFPYADVLDADIRSPKLQDLYVEHARARKGTTEYTGDFWLDLSENTAFDLKLDLLPGGRLEDVVRVFVPADGLTGNLDGHIELRGPVYDLNGDSYVHLSDVDVYGEHFEIGDGSGRMNNGVFELDHLTLRRATDPKSPVRDEIIATGGVKRAYKLDFDIVGHHLRAEHLTHLAAQQGQLKGDLRARAHVGGTLQDPAPSGQIDLLRATYAGSDPTDSTVSFDTTSGVTAFTAKLIDRSIDVWGSVGLWGDQPYVVDATLQDAPLHVFYPRAADGTPITAQLSGEIRLNGQFGEHPTPVDIVADASKFDFGWDTTRIHNVGRWHYEQHGERFRLDDFGLQGDKTMFRLDASGDDERLTIGGLGFVDTNLLRVVVPGLQRADGTANVAVNATGKAPNLTTEVSVTLDAPLVRHASFPGTFEDVHAVVHANRDRWRLDEASATLGGGKVTASGALKTDDWRPMRADFEAHGQNTQLRWVDWLPPAIVTSDLTFDGPMNQLLLGGEVRIEDMTFSDRIDWEDWVVEWKDQLLVAPTVDDSAPLFSLDVGISADRSIRLRNNVAEGNASAALKVIGDTNRPGLVGSISVDDGLAYMRDREFRIDRSEIAFRDPWTWDPDLDFELVTDITSRDRRYRIKYVVTGPFSNWKADTRSDPALPQSDVNALLWFGVTADDLEGMGGLSQAIGGSVADMLLSDFLVTNQAARELQQELTLLDRVDLVTGITPRGEYSSDPRLRVEKRLPELNDLSVIGEVNMLRPEDQYWRADYPISDAWSLSAWYATRQRDRTLQIGGAYGLDVRARWEMDGR